MPLEIKELVIKASVRQNLNTAEEKLARTEDLASLKRQVLRECRRMIQEAMRESHRR